MSLIFCLDPRSFLVRRLNDWFANICQNRPSRSTLNTRNEDQFEDSTSTSLSTTNDDEKSSPTDEKPGPSCSFQNVQDKSESETEEEQKSAELRFCLSRIFKLKKNESLKKVFYKKGDKIYFRQLAASLVLALERNKP